MGKLAEFFGQFSFGLQQAEQRSLSLENPATPLSAPADWLFETLSGGFGLDGQIHVNEHTAMQLTTVRACVKAISEDVGTVPLHLFSEDSKGTRKKATNRPEYDLLRKRPNPHMTACTFRQVMTANALVWGNAFAEIEYNGAGKVTNLWPLYPQFVRPELTKSNTLRYVSTNPRTAETKCILSDDMLHIKDCSMDGYVGLYTIRHHRTTVGLGLALENFGLYYFLNGSRPGGVLELMGKMTPEAQERIRQSWHSIFTGPRNANKIAILEEGMSFKPMTIANDAAQYVETCKLNADDIARLFRIPPHIIGILEKATFSNIEHQSLDYVKSCLRPWFVRWEEELNAKLFPSSQYFFEHDEDGLLRGDFGTRMDGYSKGRQWGWLSANDIRRSENMNVIGPEGDIYLTPLNMVPADSIEDQLAAQAGKPDTDKGDEAGKQSAEGEDVVTDPALRQLPPEATPPQLTMGPDKVREYARGLFEDAVRRSVKYDRSAQLQKSVSQAFMRVLELMGKMMGRDDAEVAARAYAADLYLRCDEWDTMTTQQIVDKEFDLACSALQPQEATR